MNTSSTICSETSENSCSVFERNKGFIVRMCGPRVRSGCRLRVFAKVCVFSGPKGPQKKSRGREESSGIIHSLSASIQSFGQPHTENTHTLKIHTNTLRFAETILASAPVTLSSAAACAAVRDSTSGRVSQI